VFDVSDSVPPHDESIVEQRSTTPKMVADDGFRRTTAGVPAKMSISICKKG
jgi:hypothetical protein